MTKAQFDAELEALLQRRNAALLRLKGRGMSLTDVAQQTGFSRRLVAEVCGPEPRRPAARGELSLGGRRR